MWKYCKIFLIILVLAVSGSKVIAQSKANASAFATIINPVGLNGLADEEIQLNINKSGYFNIYGNTGNPWTVLPVISRLLQKNIESGNLVVSAANEDTYGITSPASIIFHCEGEGNYLRGVLSFTDLDASNASLKLQLDIYAAGPALPGKYSSLPAEIVVNFN